MSKIKHTMPDVIYVGFESNAVHTMFPSWYSCTYKNSTSYTRTDKYKTIKAELESFKSSHATLLGIVEDSFMEFGDQLNSNGRERFEYALNKAKGLGE